MTTDVVSDERFLSLLREDSSKIFKCEFRDPYWDKTGRSI